jgi:hypothetical protein
MDDIGDAGMGQDVGDISIDTDGDGDMDFYGDIMSKEAPGAEMEDDAEMEDEGMEGEDMEDEMSDDEMMDEYNEADMGLDDVIRELEEDMAMNDEELPEDAHEKAMPEGDYSMEEDEHSAEEGVYSESIDDIISEILAEEEGDEEGEEKTVPVEEAQIGASSIDSSGNNLQEALTALEESYKTVKHLKSVINEVNLLNAKLLYTNKLFRNFELSESQKMKVIENFDRASTIREVKLVYATLSEGFSMTGKTKRTIKESYASKPSRSTAPNKKVISEGNDLTARWRKLANL